MTTISIKNLSAHYNGHPVLDNLMCSVEKGQFVAVIGKSGSGKTTLLKAIANLIEFEGEIIAPPSLGVVFQHYAVFPWMTVSQNIGFGLDRSSGTEKQKIIDMHLNLAGLINKKDSYPDELSGGQNQRVAIARSLAANPEVLLMDEPFGALDAYTRDAMQEWLLRLYEHHKKTIIFVTHNIEEAVFLADRILLLEEGSFTREFSVPYARPRRAELKFTAQFNELRKQISNVLMS